MEKINKNNYEAYFLDYLEGNLGAEEIQDLFVFLTKNPELKQELDIDLTEFKLTPDTISFDQKEALKTEEDQLLNLNTVHAWMVDAVEKNLSPAGEQKLNDFIRAHRLEKEFKAYQSTVLKPDLSIVYAEKNKLKVAGGVVIPLYVRVASVAAVGIVLISVALNSFLSRENSPADLPQTATNAIQKMKTDYPNHLNAMAGIENQMVTTEQQIKDNNVVGYDLIVNNIHSDSDTAAYKDSSYFHTPENSSFIAEHDEKDDTEFEFIQPIPEDENDVVLTSFNSKAKPSLLVEEPYKIVTDAASNVTHREINFTRQKDVETNEYVAFGFKIGNFEFERKKSE